MNKIITITLNPALDNHYNVPEFIPFGENYIKNSICSAGGKGVNVSRVLNVLGVKNTAIIVIGKQNSDKFEPYLKRASMNYVPIYTSGSVRENITIHAEGKDDTRISLDDFSITDDILKQAFEAVDCAEGDVVIFAGRIPNGAKKSQIIDYLKAIKSKGALLAVDSNSFNIDEIIEISPWLIKPNENELSALINMKVDDVDCAMSAAKKLNDLGVTNVIASLGKTGAVFSSSALKLFVKVPQISPLSTVGAGDSTLAGFVAEYMRSGDLKECMKNACACGTAACLVEGTEPPTIDKVINIKQNVIIEVI